VRLHQPMPRRLLQYELHRRRCVLHRLQRQHARPRCTRQRNVVKIAR
jgi:hypothetical protein